MDYNYLIAELNAKIANMERLKRGLEQERDAARNSAPSEVEYDRGLLAEPPRAVQPAQQEAPKCKCGLPAVFKKSAPQKPNQWAAYFCARPPRDTKNCGFKQWID